MAGQDRARLDSSPPRPKWSRSRAPSSVSRTPTFRSCCSARAAPARNCWPAGSTKQQAARTGAFVAINCAAIPENLLESELFGHEKGAFTGAVKTNRRQDRTGRRRDACSSTRSATSRCRLQVKLLRFLQERVIERIGGRKPIAVDTRIVCATHQDLEAMIADGRFREDLFYRLAEIVVKIPPLAERPGDRGAARQGVPQALRAGNEPAGQGLRARRARGDRRVAAGPATCASSKIG